ncbi:hypothetical protein [Caviibacter abscessus]|uniref:hypothetical protein n=1 Tax=Caviibacter abscessus TaxID=1766719 RepID=UPI00083912AE|nr:hypothetical protein [Caviibacter abscessus]
MTKLGKIVFGLLFLIINFGIIGYQQIKIQQVESKYTKLLQQEKDLKELIKQYEEFIIEQATNIESEEK